MACDIQSIQARNGRASGSGCARCTIERTSRGETDIGPTRGQGACGAGARRSLRTTSSTFGIGARGNIERAENEIACFDFALDSCAVTVQESVSRCPDARLGHRSWAEPEIAAATSSSIGVR